MTGGCQERLLLAWSQRTKKQVCIFTTGKYNIK